MFVSETITSDTSIEAMVANYRANAKAWINSELKRRRAPIMFDALTILVLEQFMLRETDVKTSALSLPTQVL